MKFKKLVFTPTEFPKDNYEAEGDFGIKKSEYRVFIGTTGQVVVIFEYKFIHEEGEVKSIEEGMELAQAHYEKECQKILDAILERD